MGWFIDAGIGKSRPYNSKGGENHSDDYDEKYVSARLDHRFDARNSLTLDIQHYSNQYNKYRSDRSLFYFPSNYTPKHENDNQVALTYKFKEETSTPGFLRYFNNYSNVDNTLYGKGKSRLQGADYQNGWEMGQHRLIVGVEWHQSSDEHERWDYAQKKINNQAYYIQDTITMGDKWTVVPGTRFDHNSNFGGQWSPKLAANYQPDDQTKIFASWGRVYQAPNARQLYTNMTRWMSIDGVPYRYENWLGSKSLEPETGHTETIGIEHDFSDKVNASLSLFNANISGYLDLNDYGSTYESESYPYIAQLLDLNYVNSSKDKQRGVNLMYRQKMDDHWSYDVGYAYTYRDRPLGSEEYLNHWRVPKNSYRTSIRYQNGPWRAALHGLVGTGTGGTNYMEDDFSLLDFNISCEVTDWARVYAKAINFTNQNHSYYGRNTNAPGRLFQFGLDCYF